MLIIFFLYHLSYLQYDFHTTHFDLSCSFIEFYTQLVADHVIGHELFLCKHLLKLFAVFHFQSPLHLLLFVHFSFPRSISPLLDLAWFVLPLLFKQLFNRLLYYVISSPPPPPISSFTALHIFHWFPIIL